MMFFNYDTINYEAHLHPQKKSNMISTRGNSTHLKHITGLMPAQLDGLINNAGLCIVFTQCENMRYSRESKAIVSIFLFQLLQD